MKKTSDTKYSSTKFLLSFSIFTVLILFCIGLVSYIVDPFFKYRLKDDNKYLLNTRFVNPGLIKHYDYNMVVLGSSMVQNYDLSLLKTDPSIKPLKVAIGATNSEEIALTYSLLDKQKTNSIVINIDLITLNQITEIIKYPEYAYKDDILHQLNYLYSYETCVRYTPVDVALSLYGNFSSEIPDELKIKTDIEKIGFSYDRNGYFNKKYYLEYLYRSDSGVIPQVVSGMEDRMKGRIDKFINRLDINNHKHINYTFVLPPYSVAYWGYTDAMGYYNHLENAVRYLQQKLSKYNNVRLLCFYDIDAIMDLDGYADLTHYNPDISDFIVNNLNNDEYMLTPSNVEQRLHNLDSMVSIFNKEYAEWNN